jgi:hypothetical protein
MTEKCNEEDWLFNLHAGFEIIRGASSYVHRGSCRIGE